MRVDHLTLSHVSRMMTRTLLLGGALALAAACSERGPAGLDRGDPLESVAISPSIDTIEVGGSLQLSAVVRDTTGQVHQRAIAWSSSNAAVATVTPAGLVQGLAPGRVTITAAADTGGATGTADVVVLAPPPPPPPAPVATVSVAPGSATVPAGQTLQLTATVRDAGNNVLTGRTVTWSSSNTSAATVSGSGLVTAVAGGSATITATSEGRTGTSAVTVTTPPPPPPLGSSEPTYAATDHALILEDHFDYSSRTAMLAAYPTGRRTEYVDLITGRGGSGGAARLRYGTPGGTYDLIFGPENRLTSVGGWNGTLPQKAGPYTHFIFTTWFRFSAGADPAATNSWGVKGFMFWHTGTQQGGRYQNAINQGSADGLTRGPKGANPCNAQSGLNLYRTADGCAPLFSTLADGNWHRFTIEIYAGNDPSGHRGERYWVDGNLIYNDIDVPGIGQGTAVDHYAYAYAIRHWMVFGNFITEGAMSPFFTFDVDDWMAWTDR